MYVANVTSMVEESEEARAAAIEPDAIVAVSKDPWLRNATACAPRTSFDLLAGDVILAA